MRRLYVLLAVALVLVVVPVAEGSDSWSSLKKSLVGAVEDGESIEDTLTRARAVIADGKPRASKLMCQILDDVVDREWARQDEAAEVAAKIYRGKKVHKSWSTWSKEVHQQIDRLLQRAAIDRELGLRLGDEMAKAPEAFRTALVEAAKKRKDGRLHAVAVRMMANLPKDSAAISYVLWVVASEAQRDKPAVRLAALRALEINPEAWSGIIADQINDVEWTLQVDAARIAAKYGLGAALGEMIGGLSCASPRVQQAFVGSLQAMTGQTIGLYPDRWRFWWDVNKKYYGKDARPAKGGDCRFGRYVPFYDLEIHSRRVLFVVDISGSMTNRATEYVGTDGEPVLSTEFTRIDLVRGQLERAIRGLPDDAAFNVVAFGVKIIAWKKEMTSSDEKSRKSAIRWVEKLQPEGATQLNGAMHAVFGKMGFGDATVAPITADTMVVLSDGSPTDGWPAGRGPAGREVVLDHVNSWNRDKSVVIHTVALRGADVDFLTRLAEDNGGQCSVR